MKNRTLLLVLAVIALVGGWYAFRPEKLFIHTSVNESLPSMPASAAAMTTDTEPTVLASGMFHSGAHETAGKAAIYRLADGTRVLRFTDFHTSNGPDVNVYLVAADDAKDNETVTKAGFISLGSIKGTMGDQNYPIPDDLDLAKYRAVTVWCKRFSVNFGTAPLSMPGMTG
jgi:hypothetical protein